jgi:hypothetical protein
MWPYGSPPRASQSVFRTWRQPISSREFIPNRTLREAGMDIPASYLDLGFIHISIPNLAVIVGMIVLFAIALFAPFPHGEEVDDVRNK